MNLSRERTAIERMCVAKFGQSAMQQCGSIAVDPNFGLFSINAAVNSRLTETLGSASYAEHSSIHALKPPQPPDNLRPIFTMFSHREAKPHCKKAPSRMLFGLAKRPGKHWSDTAPRGLNQHCVNHWNQLRTRRKMNL